MILINDLFGFFLFFFSLTAFNASVLMLNFWDLDHCMSRCTFILVMGS